MIREIGLWSNALQRLSDDLRSIERNTKKRFGNLGYFTLLLFGGATAGHGGRGADADDVVAAEGEAAAPDQQSNVRTLSAAVGMQFVENEEAHTLRGANQFAVLAAGEQQLQHHVVGEEEVRWITTNHLLFDNLLLTRISGKADGWLPFRLTLLKELLEFFFLTVGQGVHRIHHNGLDAPSRPIP